MSRHIEFRAQVASPAPLPTKIRLSFLAMAISDALGAPTEFKRRFSFDFLTTMEPNGSFNQPKGVWTDDTSMMLCLAKSITQSRGFNPIDQLATYCRWWPDGYLSAVPQPFDIGNTIARALYLYRTNIHEEPDNILSIIQAELGRDDKKGNGSLMRLLPVPLVYWQLEEDEARTYARRMSQTTHPSPMCVEVCEMWTCTLRHVLQHTCVDGAPPLTKLDVLHFVGSYPYVHPTVKAALSTEETAPLQVPEDPIERSSYYEKHHPIAHLIATCRTREPYSGFLRLPTETEMSSAGHVVLSAVAALFCFLATVTFEEGVIMAANLGGDSDTVGAIYGGLAGIWYGRTADSTINDDFWTERVREWERDLVNEQVVLEIAEELVTFCQEEK